MTTIEQSSFTRLLEAAELVRSGFPFNCYGDLKELHQAVEAARADRALYEAAGMLLAACRTAKSAFQTIATDHRNVDPTSKEGEYAEDYAAEMAAAIALATRPQP